jgi:RNA polymerase sigma-70 factor (ECF subfamily)
MFPQSAGTTLGAGDDAALVRRIVAGERELYGVLVERYQRRLWWSCRRMLGDPDEAEDVVQETLVSAYQHLADFDPTRRFYTWLYAIARNRCLNVLRRRKVWGFRRLDAPGDEPAEDAASGGGTAAALAGSDDAATLVESREIAEALAACLETLPEEQRVCFELRHGEEFSYAEIASVLGIPPGTVMSRLARAREKMRACLEGKGVGGTT